MEKILTFTQRTSKLILKFSKSMKKSIRIRYSRHLTMRDLNSKAMVKIKMKMKMMKAKVKRIMEMRKVAKIMIMKRAMREMKNNQDCT